ncbi:MAG TPA: PAS domain S-box protein [Ignavibacteria bacterium]|nr:PAS domain S-box protein [Ignavibacteria bacterium]
MPIAKVLIVEDEAITALDIKNILQRLNYEVVGIASKGEAALSMIEETNPGLILMDITLKGDLDGIDTALILRRTHNIPVVYLTAHSDDETIERSKQTDPYGFLLKPLNERDLNSCIRLALYRFDADRKLKETEEVLKDTQKKNEILLSSLEGTVFIMNPRGVVTWYSPYRTENLQMKSGSPVNRRIAEVFNGELGLRFLHNTEAAYTGNKEVQFSFYTLKGNKKVSFKASIKPYGPGELIGIVSEIDDNGRIFSALNQSESKYRNLMNNSPVAITRLLVSSNKYEIVNSEFERQSGYTLEEFNNLSDEEYAAMIYRDDRKHLVKEYSAWIKEGSEGIKNLVYRIINKKGEVIWLDSYHYADRDAAGNPVAINQIYLNINKQKQYEEILSESKQYLDALFTQTLDGIYIAKLPEPVDWKNTDNREKLLESILDEIKIVRVNQPLCEQLGMTESEATRVAMRSFYRNEIDKARKRWIEFLDNGSSHVKEYFSKPDGTQIYIEGDYYCLYNNNGMFTGYMGIQRDVTQKRDAEQKLKLSEEKFRAVAESMPAQVVIFQDNSFVFANKFSETITGYKTEELMKKNFWDLVHPDYIGIVKERGEKRQKGEPVPSSYEMKIIAKNGAEKWLNYSARIIDYDGKRAVLGIATDITESKKSQDKIRLSEEKYRNFVEQSSEGIFRLEFKKPVSVKLAADEQVELIIKNVYIAECNHVFARMYEELPENIIGCNVSMLKYQNPEGNARILKFIMNDYKVIEDEVSEFSADGHEKNFIVNISGVIEDGYLTSVWGVQHDISEKKKAEEALKRSLKEKEILLKEIHHRVKNNLQIVTSLLKLQSGYVKDEKIKQLFKESQNRVQSMSLIHQKLYQTKDLANIDFREYLATLSTHLQHSFGILEDRVKIITEVNNMAMSIDNAIPAGLIVNELVSNALKHAFPGDRKGTININAAYDEYNNNYWIVVRDNGIGMSKDIDFESAASFGLKLVSTLVKQLDGEMELVAAGGSEFRITFKSSEYKDRS